MLYCPKCRGEFEDWAKTCPDCQVALVAEPPPPPGKSPRLDPIGGLKHSPGHPRVLLTMAGATMFLALCGLISYSVGFAGEEAASGWAFSGIILSVLANAIFYPGVLLGLAALAIPQWIAGPADAHRVFRLLAIAAIALVFLGVGQAITTAGQYPGVPQSDWVTAGVVLLELARRVFYAGVLLGLAYLCLLRARATDSVKGVTQQPEP